MKLMKTLILVILLVLPLLTTFYHFQSFDYNLYAQSTLGLGFYRIYNASPISDPYDYTYGVVKGNATATEIYVADIFAGRPVTAVGWHGFSKFSNMTSIRLPAGLTYISPNAFSGCSSLTSIAIPSGVTSIYDYTFFGCSSMTTITLPAGITSIGDYAFWNSRNLSNISLPASVTSIGIGAFEGCRSLTSITLPAGMTSVGSYAFASCSSLTIYAEAESKPEGWAEDWNILDPWGNPPTYVPIVWGRVSESEEVSKAVNTELFANYPNPFNPSTTLRFMVGDGGQGTGIRDNRSTHVSINVYNIRGHLVKTLVSGDYSVGEHSVVWNGTDDKGRAVGSGMYFYRMTTSDFVQTRRMVLLK